MSTFTQPFVFRAYFSSESDVHAAQKSLNGVDVRPDYIKSFGRDEPAKWKLVFADANLDKVKALVAGLSPKPVKVDYFDPTDSELGWASDFKPLSV